MIFPQDDCDDCKPERSEVGKTLDYVHDAIDEIRKTNPELAHKTQMGVLDRLSDMLDHMEASSQKLSDILNGTETEYCNGKIMPEEYATKRVMKYRDQAGTVEYSPEDNCFFGKLINMRDLYSYEAWNLEELETSFKEAVDYYLLDKDEKV